MDHLIPRKERHVRERREGKELYDQKDYDMLQDRSI